MEFDIKKKIKVAIIDDEKASVTVLEKGLKAFSNVKVIAKGSNINDMLTIIRAKHPDILFLDVMLNDDSSLDVIAALDKRVTDGMKIVIYSSYQHYLLQALRIKAFDYLLKPLDSEQLSIIIHRYMIDDNDCEPSSFMPSLPISIPGEKRLSLTTMTNEKRVISSDGIIYFKFDSRKKIWIAVLFDMSRVLLKAGISSTDLLSSSNSFAQTHRNYIINVSYINTITLTHCELLPPYQNITEIQISKVYRKNLLDKFFDI